MDKTTEFDCGEIIASYTLAQAVDDGVLVKLLVNLSSIGLGQIVFTRGVYDAVNESPGFAKHVYLSMNRFVRHDWGEMDKEDLRSNNLALEKGGRLFASYDSANGGGFPKIWVITEADRSVTTVLFPEEY